MIILTGGAGFIGSCFLTKLNHENVDDIIIVDDLGCSDKWKNIRGKKFTDYIHKSKFLELIQNNKINKVEAIVHLGANSSTTEKNVDELLENNYRYSRILAEWSLRRKIRFIYASSAATYGDGSLGFSDDERYLDKLSPLNPYGYSKHIFDLWIFRNRLTNKVVGLKFFNVYGPNEYHKGSMRSVVCKAYDEIQISGKIRLFKSYNPKYKDGEQERDFLYVKDCTEVMWWLLNHDEVNGIYNLGTGKARTWNDLAKAVFSALNIPVNIEYVDMPEELRLSYQYHTQAEMEKLRKTGYLQEFTSLEDGVRDYIQNYLHPIKNYH